MTLPGAAGTSSIQTWPAGTVMVLPLASRLSVEVSLSLLHVARMTRPSWKSQAGPLPTKCVSGT